MKEEPFKNTICYQNWEENAVRVAELLALLELTSVIEKERKTH